MTSDELRKIINDYWGDCSPTFLGVIDELTTRLDLMQAAIVAKNNRDCGASFEAAIKALVAHTAPEKKPYTVDDIRLEYDTTGTQATVRCGKFVWRFDGWFMSSLSYTYSPCTAKVIAAGLRATGNVPGGGQ